MATQKKPTKKQQNSLFSSKKEKRMLLFVSVSLFLLVGLTIIWFARAGVEPSKTYITKVTDLGFLTFSTPNSGRDGGNSALVGGKVLWSFGDTFYAPKVPKFTGDLFRSSTAAIGNTTNPTQLSEPIDARGVPNQFIPYTPEQLAYNIAKTNGSDRYTIWPSGMITRPGGNSAYVFYFTLLIQPNKWIYQGVGLATVGENSTVAQRQVDTLFSADETSFRQPIVVGDMVYVYGACGAKVCPVARVPIGQVPVRSAYQFWNGTTWVSDISQAKPILPSSSLGGTVMYNRALKSYVLAYIQDYSHGIYFSYAPAPEGPWSTPIRAIDLPADKQEYVPYFHPELSSDNDVSVYISYFLTGSGGGVKLLKLTLNPPAQPIQFTPTTPPAARTTTQPSTSQQTSNNHPTGSTSKGKLLSPSGTDNTTISANTASQTVTAATNRLQNDTTNPDAQTGDQRGWWQKFLDFFTNLFNRN